MGISKDGNFFYFMDSYKIVNKLERLKDSKQLVEVEELFLKDKDRPHFMSGNNYPLIIFSDKYLIWQSKIFYLFSDTPL